MHSGVFMKNVDCSGGAKIETCPDQIVFTALRMRFIENVNRFKCEVQKQYLSGEYVPMIFSRNLKIAVCRSSPIERTGWSVVTD
jgi:hypothetical protein